MRAALTMNRSAEIWNNPEPAHGRQRVARSPIMLRCLPTARCGRTMTEVDPGCWTGGLGGADAVPF